MEYILNFGGQDEQGYSKAVDVFRVIGNRVEKVEDHGLELGVARYDLAAAASGDYILAMGGYDGTNFSKAVDVFRVTSDGVIKVDNRGLELGVGRYDLAAASLGDYILAMGGYDGANISKAVDIFEVTSNGVTKVTDHGLELSVARNGLAAASLGDYVLAMGGYDSSKHSKAVDVFRVTSAGVVKVENHGLELSVGRYNLAAAVIDNYVIAMGGNTEDDVASDVVDVFEISNGNFKIVTDHGLSLKQARAYLSAATAGNYILAMGGTFAKDSEGRSIPTNAVDVFYNYN